MSDFLGWLSIQYWRWQWNHGRIRFDVATLQENIRGPR